MEGGSIAFANIMGITNYQINKIEANVEKKQLNTVEVKNSFGLKNAKKGNTKNTLEVEWTFKSDYKGLGTINLEGTLIYFSPNLDNDIREKGKDIVLVSEALKEVSNFVLRRGIVEAIEISNKMQIPAPIRMPSVNIETADAKKKKAS